MLEACLWVGASSKLPSGYHATDDSEVTTSEGLMVCLVPVPQFVSPSAQVAISRNLRDILLPNQVVNTFCYDAGDRHHVAGGDVHAGLRVPQPAGVQTAARHGFRRHGAAPSANTRYKCRWGCSAARQRQNAKFFHMNRNSA